MKRIEIGSLALATLLAACASSPPPAPAAPAEPVVVTPPAPTTPPPPAKEQPPAPLASRASPFPAVGRTTLANGLRVSVVESHALPVIEVRVVVHAGEGFGQPGVGEITGTMLKEGGTRAHTASDLTKRIETLGSSLGVHVGPDATELSMGVVRGQLDEAMGVLGEVIRTPRFDGAELTRLKARMTDEVLEAARSEGTWTATRILFHAMFPPASPYASYSAVPSEIAKVNGGAIRDFHKRFYVPSNVEIIVAGDVDTDGARKAIDKAFGDWPATSAAPKVDFPEPMAPDVTRVIVADRPKSVQSDVVVSQLLPARHAPNWPAVRVALQVFGANATGRLFQDLREKRSLAYRADARAIELSHDALPLFAIVGTQAPRTADAVQGILENMTGMRTSPPSDDEVLSARRYITDVFAVRMETIGAIASMVAQLRTLDLPDDYWDTYRTAVRAVTTADADDPSAHVFMPDHALIIVAGDADVVAAPLARFGEVTVVDPEHEFRVVRTIPKSGAK